MSLLQKSPRNLDSDIIKISENINKDTGFFWWKGYTYSAFWSIISTPINLSITVFTALTTAQTSTESLISPSVGITIGICTLILSVINTFFKPYSKLTNSKKITEKWSDIGVEFENLHISSTYNDQDKKTKLQNLEQLWEKVCSLKKNEDNNYLIDLIFLISRTFCIRKSIRWLPEGREKSRIIKERQENSRERESVV